MSIPVVLVAAFLAGAIPFAQIAARVRRGVDLREVGSGTVSGTGLYEVSNFATLAVAGVFEVAKGTVGPLLAGSDRPVLAALAGGLAVVGHNWSPFLRGAGGRGISPSLGALLITAWPGALVLGLGMGLGKLARQTGLGSFVADLLLVPVVTVTHGPTGALAGASVVAPMLVKRVVGNRPPPPPRGRTMLTRLVFDRDRVHERPAGAASDSADTSGRNGP